MRPKRIVAIYAGWRGRSAKIQPLEDLSFWARKQVARRIAEGDFIELLTRVELFVHRANQTDPERARLAIIGHSFGGTIVYASLANILKARVLEARDAPARGDRVIRGYGDLIVLINPAFEASLYAPLNELAAGFGAFSPLQPPVLLTIASETDRPNGLWFPLGRYLETLFQNMGDRSPRAAAITAVGNYQQFWTHRLTAAVPPPAGARRDSFGSSSKNCACQLPLDPIDDREAATLVALLSGEGTQAPAPGEAAAPYGRALLTCLKPIGQGNPFWVVRASGDVMHGHSGIFTTYLVDFIRRVFIEANARSHPRRQVAAQAGLRYPSAPVTERFFRSSVPESRNFLQARRAPRIVVTFPPGERRRMSVTYTIDKPLGLIRTRCFGHVTLPEVIAHFRELEMDEQCPTRLDVILDLTDTTSLPSSEQLRTVTEKIGRLRDSVRFGACAIVVGSDAWFGTAQVFEVLAARSFSATKVFREFGAAETWLEDQRSRA